MSGLAERHMRGTRTTEARESAVDLPEVVAVLDEKLGTRLLALAVGVSPRSVKRWQRSPETKVEFENETRLRAVYQVVRLLQPVEAAPTIRAWFMGMNPQLEDRSPAEGIRDGDARDVMAAARAFINAG